MFETWKSMGLLRNLLHCLAVLFILVLPFSEPKRILAGWDLLFGGIIPATAPIIFIVLMFDILMSQVMKSEGGEAEMTRYQNITRAHLILGLTLLGFWLFSFRDALF